MRILTATFVLLIATALPASAQIFTWRDASGTLVLSNHPRDGATSRPVTYAVSGSPLVRTTAKPARPDVHSRYDDLIRQHADHFGVSVDLVRAVIQAESGFNAWAVSPKGALGLMQLMPATARELGVSDPFHPDENIRGGVTYLARLLSRYGQNVELALAAYNAGPGSVERYGQTVPPYRETRAYVRRITAKTGVTRATVAPPPVIYRWSEIVDGRITTRFSNVAPTHSPYDIVGQR